MTTRQNSLFHKGTGRFAILSQEFTQVKIHYDKQNRKYVLCLSPQTCKYCQMQKESQLRWGAWVWDYEDQGQYPIKLFAHMSKNLNKVFYAILKKGGLNYDFMAEKRTNQHNRSMTYVNQQDGAPHWFNNFRDQVGAAWEGYKNKDIANYLGKALTYQEQEQLLSGGGDNGYQPQGGYNQGQGYSNNNNNNNNDAANFLNSGSSSQQGQTREPQYNNGQSQTNQNNNTPNYSPNNNTPPPNNYQQPDNNYQPSNNNNYQPPANNNQDNYCNHNNSYQSNQPTKQSPNKNQPQSDNTIPSGNVDDLV